MTHFRPISEAEHERGNRGEDVPDYCANCGKPFMEHTNGKCYEPIMLRRIREPNSPPMYIQQFGRAKR